MSTRAHNTPATDIVDEDGVLCLRGDLFWKWRALEAELRAHQLEIEAAQVKIAVEVEKNPTLKELLSRKASLAGLLSTARAELLTLQNEIELRFGISLKNCAFDDKTGRIYQLNEDESLEDTKPIKRSARTRVKR